ncbi:MAG TPA: PSD1 and planctomycete cytochrome C domain-containing protein [Gemmataceae bacterium]|nr:PSD1 and planctomycete cytochrome C domain-containing protein [Gemmataceae bacterium]
MNSALLLAALIVGAPPEPDYLRDVKPLLQKKCAACHGAVRQKAGLRLDAAPLILKGNKHGSVVVPGKPEESLLIEMIGGDSPRMPPKGEGEHLSAKDFEIVKEWIRLGAKMPHEPIPPGPKDHWAYQPPTRPSVPGMTGVGNPIDAFLAVEREKHKAPTNPEADRPTLLRRVYIDLIGVPPTPDELHAFLQDTSTDAYEKVVDRLLRSPMYGERWGRHWMDVWRYSDPFGLGEEYRYSQRHIWRWRDWIIESLNADKGYDRMILEMLAADEIAPADRDALRATGYLARNWYKFNRTVWLQDTVEYTAAGFLGITMRCCRCHDHKYDPISQQDYYRFRAFFEPHDVRIDTMPGQPDILKDGLARVFDSKPNDPTFLFARGDERMPDKSKTLTPGVPGVLGADPAIAAVTFSVKDFAAALPEAAAAARRVARNDIDVAEAEVKRANDAVAAAKRKLEQIAAGTQPKEPEIKAFLHDTFAKKNDDLWKIISGTWAWENGKLVCKLPSTFATVTAKQNHPAALMGRIRFKTTGGGVGSVGFSYDVAGKDFQAAYINAGKTSAVRPFHRVNGADTYPSAGVVPHPVNFNDDVTLDFAVRGNLLNVWVNGKLTSVYRLPIARKPGTFTIWAHDAMVEFHEVRLAELPDAVVLADKPGDMRPSPIGVPIILTKGDAEKQVKQAEATVARAIARLAIALASADGVEARVAADARKLASAAEATWKPLALAAGKAERREAALKAAESLVVLEQATPVDMAKVTTAKKTKEAADAAAAKDDPTYTSLVKVDPATSTGRRLALAKWIADAKNPLTARVAVNHIWMRHFGTPLVPTVANFGLNGKPPTHPELLDWLAVEFTESGWSMSRLHRLMVTSRAYRLSSRTREKAVDVENRYYGRMNPRRMEAEVVRDSLLAVAGQLDHAMGGPIIDEKLGQTSRRRSVYFRFNTEYKMQFLDQFDAASPTECYERRESVIPQQALALHNSVMALNLSRELARQIAASKLEFVDAAFEHVLTRPPTPDERARCENFIREQTALYQSTNKLTPFPPGPAGVTPPSNDPAQHAREDLIQVLFNHNDFVTVR